MKQLETITREELSDYACRRVFANMYDVPLQKHHKLDHNIVEIIKATSDAIFDYLQNGQSDAPPKLKRCPDCGEAVDNYFDHVDRDEFCTPPEPETSA